MYKRHYIFILAFSLLSIIGAGIFLFDRYVPEQHKRTSQAVMLAREAVNTNVVEGEKIWQEIIREYGSKDAYGIFATAYETLSPGRQHLLAHVFGGALYDVEKLNGVSTCDSNYSFGCFHEFLGRAIYTEGMPIITKLNSKCIDVLAEQALGCQHGIGHGIQAALGYEFNNLVESLELCDSLPFGDPIGGCTGGAFMEYNFQTVRGEDADTRLYDAVKGPYYPCDVLEDSDHQRSCYYWQPQWWQPALRFSGSIFEQYDKFGALCEEIPNMEYRSQCYRGIGNNALGGEVSSAPDMIAVCSRMPTHFGEVECRGAAAGAFAAVVSLKASAHQVCEGLDSPDAERCLDISNLPDPGAR